MNENHTRMDVECDLYIHMSFWPQFLIVYFNLKSNFFEQELKAEYKLVVFNLSKHTFIFFFSHTFFFNLRFLSLIGAFKGSIDVVASIENQTTILYLYLHTNFH